jgi:hypothetical protein
MSKRTFQLLLVACLVAGTLWAANDPFVGKWKLDPSKSKVIDYMKVRSLGGNRYALDLGGGEVETIVANGKDQPGVDATTLSVSVEGPVNWKVVRKEGGRTLVTGNWKLSNDGNTLTDDYTEYHPKGSNFHQYYLYKRTAGGSGFAATWVSTSEPHSAFELQIRPYGGDGLSFAYPHVTLNMNCDGKDYPDLRPNMPPGSAYSARRANERTLEVTHKTKGKVRNTWEVSLSPDLKTVTLALHSPGLSTPSIFVFDRE